MNLDHLLSHLTALVSAAVPRINYQRVLVSSNPPPKDFGSFVSVRDSIRSASQHIVLGVKESKRFEFALQETGRYDVAIQNPSESFCVITELVYLGRKVHGGACVCATGQGQVGHLLLVTVERIDTPWRTNSNE